MAVKFYVIHLHERFGGILLKCAEVHVNFQFQGVVEYMYTNILQNNISGFYCTQFMYTNIPIQAFLQKEVFKTEAIRFTFYAFAKLLPEQLKSLKNRRLL